jgi:hypothetical protein
LNGKAAWSGFQQIWQPRDKSIGEGDGWDRNVKAVNGVFVRKRSQIRSSQKSGDGILPGARAGRDIRRNWAMAGRGIEREKETIVTNIIIIPRQSYHDSAFLNAYGLWFGHLSKKLRSLFNKGLLE